MFFLLINFLAFIWVIVASAILLLNKHIRFPFKVLAIWMVMNLIFLPYPILIDLNQFQNFPHYYRIPAPFLYLLGPLLYIFTRSLLNDEKKFYTTDWLHAIPFVFHLIELIPFYLSPASVKLELINQADWNNLNIFLSAKEGFLNAKFHSILKLISWFVYLLLSINLLHNYLNVTSRIKNAISTFLFLLFSLRIIHLIFTFLGVFLPRSTYSEYLINLPNSLTLILMVSYLLKETIKLSGISNEEFSKQFTSLTELKLREKQIKLHALDNASDEIFFFIGHNLELLHFNKAAENYISIILQKKLVQGVSLKNVLSEPNFKFVLSPLQQILLDKKQINLEHELISSNNGQKEWVSISLNPIYDDDYNFLGISVVTKNISHIKVIETQNLLQKKNLDQIAWNHSHEMRAPLANIMGLANQIAKPSNVIEQSTLIKYLLAEAEKLDNIIRNNVTQASSSKK